MEEKILIKSETNELVRRFLKLAPIVLIGIAALISICLSFEYEVMYEIDRHRYISTDTGWYWAFCWIAGRVPIDFLIHFLISFIIGCVCLLAGITIGIIYLANRNCELQVTENNVKGKTLFGKEVVLPLYMISAYSTRSFLSVISVATASGVTQFSLIQNYKEIGAVLAQKINERQQNTATATATIAPQLQSTPIDDLKKLKELLDMGIITQEEFDAKKKELIGL